MIPRTVWTAVILAALSPAAAMASGPGIAAMKTWVSADKCAQRAQQAFPDNTVESLAKRDAALKTCLAGQGLPPRDANSLPPGTKP